MFYNKKHSNLVVLINIVEATVPWNIGSDLLAWNERKIHEIWVQVHGEGEDVKYMLRDLHRYVTFMKRRIQPFSSIGKIFAQSLYKVICNTHTHTHTLSLSLSLSLSLLLARSFILRPSFLFTTLLWKSELTVLDQLHTDALAHGRVGLLRLNASAKMKIRN